MSLVESVLHRISRGLTSTFAQYLKGAVLSKFSAHRLVAADNGIRRHNPGTDLYYGQLYPLYCYSGLKRFGPAIATSVGFGFAQQLRLAPPRPWCIPLSPRPLIEPLHERMVSSGSSSPRRHEASSISYGALTNSTYADIDVSERAHDSIHDLSNDSFLNERRLEHYGHPRTPLPFQLQEVLSDLPVEAQVPLYFPPPVPKLGPVDLPVIPEKYLRTNVQATQPPYNAWPQVAGVEGAQQEHFLGTRAYERIVGADQLPTMYQLVLDEHYNPTEVAWNASPSHYDGPAYVKSSPHQLSSQAQLQAWPQENGPDARFLCAPTHFYPSPSNSDERAAHAIGHSPTDAVLPGHGTAQQQWTTGVMPPQAQGHTSAPHPGHVDPAILQLGAPVLMASQRGLGVMGPGVIGEPVIPAQGNLRQPVAPATQYTTPPYNANGPNTVAGPSGWPAPNQKGPEYGMPGQGVEQTRAPSYGFPDPSDFQSSSADSSPVPRGGYLPPPLGYQPHPPGPPLPLPYPVLQGRPESILNRILLNGDHRPLEQNRFPKAYDGPIGPPPGLPPPQHRVFPWPGHGHFPVAGKPQPHVVNPAFGLRSDQDEIVIPNRRAQQGSPAFAPGGGYWGAPVAGPGSQWLNNITSLPAVDDGGPLCPPEPRDHELRERWQNQRPYYATNTNNPVCERPILSHNGVDFRLTARIAHGGSARVMVGVHERTGKAYAVKAVHKYLAKMVCGFARATLQTEKAVMARITERRASPYLLQLLMSWEERDIVFFVLPMMGCALDSRLADYAQITAHDKELYCAELISALDALRRHNIVHRDIKPANILIDFQGRAVLSDFGLSAITDADGTRDYHSWKYNEVVGTIGYMAPEMCHPDVDRRGYSPAVDVWSLGVVFLQIFGMSDLWGFNVGTWSEVPRMIEERLPEVRAFLSSKMGLHETAETALLKMLKADPATRIFVENLHMFVPRHTWVQVQSQTQIHDWKPDPSHGPQVPHQRDLEFQSFREKHGNRLSRKSPGYASRMRMFRLEQESANASDFEYRAREAFGDA